MNAPFPHCDSLVLHAPGDCEYCDHFPDAQASRIAKNVNFTGENNPQKEVCPSEMRRPLSTIERWPGNVAKRDG